MPGGAPGRPALSAVAQMKASTSYREYCRMSSVCHQANLAEQFWLGAAVDAGTASTVYWSFLF